MQTSIHTQLYASDQYLSSITTELSKKEIPTQNLLSSWNSVFRPLFKSEPLPEVTRTAIAFYNEIINSAFEYFKDDLLRNRRHAIATFLSKTYRYLADVYRYSNDLTLAEENYNNARILCPREGSIYVQESLLYLNSPVMRLYYLALDLASPHPSKAISVQKAVQTAANSTTNLYKQFFKEIGADKLQSIPNFGNAASFPGSVSISYLFSTIPAFNLAILLRDSDFKPLDFLVAEIFNDLYAYQTNKAMEWPMKKLQVLTSLTFHHNNFQWYHKNDTKAEWTQEWPISFIHQDLPVLCHLNVILASFYFREQNQALHNLLTFYGNSLVHNSLRATNCPAMYVLDHFLYHCPQIISRLDNAALDSLHKRITFLYGSYMSKYLLAKLKSANFANDESPFSFEPLSRHKKVISAPNSHILRTLRFYTLTNGTTNKNKASKNDAQINEFMASQAEEVGFENLDHLVNHCKMKEHNTDLFDW